MRRMFSQKQIEELIRTTYVGDIADGGLEDVDVKVNTIEQAEANWSVNDVFDDISLAEGLEYTKRYARFEEINGVLYIVHCYSITNTTENAITANISKAITLPHDVALKIFDFDGYTAAESHLANITSIQTMYGPSNEFYNEKTFTIRNVTAEDRIEYTNVSGVSIPAGQTYNFSFRAFLTLI